MSKSAVPADVVLARELVEDVLPIISDGYRELVTALRCDIVINDLVAAGRKDIDTAGTSIDKNAAMDELVATVLSSDLIARYRKANRELVSRGEKEAGVAIRRRLSVERPNDGYKGEETGAEAGRTDRLWLDDPVDGTAAMLMTAIIEAFGLDDPDPVPRFAITVGLVESGVATIGVVAELRPLRDEHPDAEAEVDAEEAAAPGLNITRWWIGQKTETGYETKLDGTQVPVEKSRTDSAVAVVTTAPEVMFLNEGGERDRMKEAGFEALLAGLGQSRPVVNGNIVRILETAGGGSVAYERDLTVEDIAAAAPILSGLQTVLTDADGRTLDFSDLDREYVVVSGVEPLWHRAVSHIREGEKALSSRLSDGSVGEEPAQGYFDTLFATFRRVGYEQKFGASVPNEESLGHG